MKQYFLPVVFFLVFGLLAAQWFLVAGASHVQNEAEDDRINLALRQVGHLLLIANGNDTSRIPPVQVLNSNEFVLRLEDGFNYDTLPYILADVFKQKELTAYYHVAIKDCETGALMLGYDYHSIENKEVACSGREQLPGCSDISVVFDRKLAQGISFKYFLGVLLIIGLLLVFYLFKNKRSKSIEYPGLFENVPEKTDGKIILGSSVLDLTNQSVDIKQIKKESSTLNNKLLTIAPTSHPNEDDASLALVVAVAADVDASPALVDAVDALAAASLALVVAVVADAAALTASTIKTQ